ncbi:MAG TPA: 6-phosphofructokinase [Anaerolineales bacterium]|nr:6-phosphofructokinase [Anaerolineales bacterium]
MSDSMRNKRLGVLTSGGDAQGMNAAVRAVVRTALEMGLQPYAIYEGYRGMVEGSNRIRKMDWDTVGGILHQGGTVIGTARCKEFMAREGRLQAAYNLILNGIDNLIVIGGDGSLTGANIFREEWPGLLQELVETGKISQDIIERHPALTIIGMVGSIDNDMCGTDMTIGADSALHRITEAIDAISSTAASHQRSFVVEVMGRRCGYLALMSALSTGADWVLIPESPPNLDRWEEKMCEVLKAGREAGRRDSIVIVAEGACDRHGNPITSQYVKQILEEKLGEDTRVTILGHVQRGGVPSAFDRNLSTILGHTAVQAIASGEVRGEAWMIGIRGNRVTRSPLMGCVNETHAVNEAIKTQNFDMAMSLRGGSFADSFRIVRTLVRALPHPPKPGQRRLRLAVMHAGGPAPGMNTAVRAAVRIGVDKGHILMGIRNGFEGFIAGDIYEMNWMSVNGWAPRGGAELGTNRKIPANSDFYAIARNIEKYAIEGLLIIGGWAAYQAAHLMYSQQYLFPAFNVPIVCLPATIDNDLPGSELSIGADTALNSIVQAVDRIKQSAVASRRCFVVEVMGDECGYLALMSGLATGAERVYLPEEGVKLNDLKKDLDNLISGFRHGKRLGLMIRNERVNEFYTTDFMAALFEEEGRELFDVRTAILGHLQQGGDPSPFDRIQAARMAARCIDYLIEHAENASHEGYFIGMQAGKMVFTSLDDLPRMIEKDRKRPKNQWWLELRPIARVLARPGPSMMGYEG